GPWSLGELDGDKVRYAVSPLPVLDVKGEGFEPPPNGRMRPLLSVEAVMVSGKTEKRELAVRVARMLAGAESSELRLTKGLQPVALKSAWQALERGELKEQDANVLKAFRAQLEHAVPTPNTP